MMQYFLLAKKLHRLLVLVMIMLAVIMSVTGGLMKYSDFVVNNMSFVDLGLVRSIHSTMSTFFSIILLLMVFSGTIMYFVPIIYSRRQNVQN